MVASCGVNRDVKPNYCERRFNCIVASSFIWVKNMSELAKTIRCRHNKTNVHDNAASILRCIRYFAKFNIHEDVDIKILQMHDEWILIFFFWDFILQLSVIVLGRWRHKDAINYLYSKNFCEFEDKCYKILRGKLL